MSAALTMWAREYQMGRRIPGVCNGVKESLRQPGNRGRGPSRFVLCGKRQAIGELCGGCSMASTLYNVSAGLAAFCDFVNREFESLADWRRCDCSPSLRRLEVHSSDCEMLLDPEIATPRRR